MKRHERYQTEIMLGNSALEKLAEQYHATWADIIPEQAWIWENLSAMLDELPPQLLVPFVMYYYDGVKIKHIATRLEVHRVTVHRRILTAVMMIKKMLGR